MLRSEKINKIFITHVKQQHIDRRWQLIKKSEGIGVFFYFLPFLRMVLG